MKDDQSEEILEIIEENEQAIDIKKSKIWEIVKRFGSCHPDLPSSIPFMYNQIEEANGGNPLSIERIVQILETEWKIKQKVDITVENVKKKVMEAKFSSQEKDDGMYL